MPVTFDKKKDTYICTVHGEIDHVGWLPCQYGCNDGWFDDYEEDPIECEPGEISRCPDCRGEAGWTVCGECNADNPDIEW